MSLQMVTITGTLKHLTGTPQTGRVEFALPYTLVDTAGHVLWSDRAVPADLDNTGSFSVQLPATDSASVSPTNWTYTVTIATDGNGDAPFQCLLPASPSTVHLDELVRVDVPPTVGVWVPVSALGTSVATLVNGTVPVSQLPAGSGGGVAAVHANVDGTTVVDNTDPQNPIVGVGAIAESKVTNLGVDLATLTAAAAAAQSSANSAASAASAAQSTANAAYVKPALGIPKTDFTSVVQTSLGAADTAYQKPGTGIPSTDMAIVVQTDLGLAATAYQKPGGGIPSSDLAGAVQTNLALAATALQVAPSDRYLSPLAAHSANVPFFSVNANSTINNEAWFGRLVVRAGSPLAVAMAVRSATAATHNTTGNNGFAIWNASASSLLWSSASDDLMWEGTGAVSKPITGIATPSIDTTFWMAVSCRGYSVAPEFGFVNIGGKAIYGDFYARYKGGGYASWPASFNPATDLATGGSFVLPLMIG